MNSLLRKVLKTSWIFCLFAMSSVMAAPIGTIEKMTGEVFITSNGAHPLKAKANDPVNEGDTLSTGKDGEAMVHFTDNSILTLRPQSQAVIAQFRHEESGKGNYAIRLFKGAFRAITGLIGKNNTQAAVYGTPAATIGIRGTDFELAIVPEDTSDTRAGTYNFVYSGSTRIALADRDNTPALDVQTDETGVALSNPAQGESPLQILKQRPAFLRGGGLDAHMMQFGAQPSRVIQFMPRR